MVELGLAIPLDSSEIQLLDCEDVRLQEILEENEQSDLLSRDEPNHRSECGMIIKKSRPQFVYMDTGARITLSLRSFDEFCHDTIHDDESSEDEVVVNLIHDMNENDWYGLPAH